MLENRSEVEDQVSQSMTFTDETILLILFSILFSTICFSAFYLIFRRNNELDREAPESNQVSPIFFTVSTEKLILNYFCSFGLYKIYWFYKNWQLIHNRSEKKIWPFGRALFFIFWAHSCFSIITKAARERSITYRHKNALLALGIILTFIIARVPGPIWLLSYLSIFMIVPLNSLAIKINKHESSDLRINSYFSTSHIFALTLGFMMFLCMIFGTVLDKT